MTNLGKYTNNVLAIKKYRDWYRYNYVSSKASKWLNEEINRLQKENDYLVKIGLNQTSEIEVTTEQFKSKIDGKNQNKINNSRAFDYK